MPLRGKLSREEIQLAVDRIVKKYDEYCTRFVKSPQIRLAFEERYFSALGAGLDMQAFLQAEIEVVEELIRRAEAQLQQAPAAERPRQSFAERVMEALRERIEKYDDVLFHPQANPEIRRLVGALSRLDREYMMPLHDALRNTSFNFNSREMVDLDARLRDMAAPHGTATPPRLARYVALLNAFPRDYSAVDREEKSFLLEAAYLLHDVRDIIRRTLESYDDLAAEDRSLLGRVDGYVAGVLEDFRIKEFRRPVP